MITGLQTWEDKQARTPPEQMAVDEALLLLAKCPVVRFYRWASPAVTFGYAQRYSDVPAGAGWGPSVRRWTGGGTVFHGEDLTMSLAVPGTRHLDRFQAEGVYRWIHGALLNAMEAVLPGVVLARPGDCRPGPACFQSPALNDILHCGKKICGGAMRRGKNGFLYQGSIHGKFSTASLAQSLGGSSACFEPAGELLDTAAVLAGEKYGTRAWNQMR
ncbi:MAG: hypothetical protein WC003_06910 [Terrimicrobiaceae bacterium]